MTVLVLGASGFIGPSVVSALGHQGVEALAASRKGGGPFGVALDRSDPAAVVRMVRARKIDTVIDLLAYTEGQTIPLFEALDGQVARWVMASSGDVYRNYEGLQRKAHPKPDLTALRESSPLRQTRYPYRTAPLRASNSQDAWMDDYDKIPLEAELRSRPDLGGVILRLPMVYGPKDRQQRFRWIIAPMTRGHASISLDPQWSGWRTTYGFVEDVAHALAVAATHPLAGGKTFNIGEADGPDHHAWIGRFAQIMGWRGDVVFSPAPKDSPLSGLDLRYPMLTDTSLFRALCGWTEPTALKDALGLTIADTRT